MSELPALLLPREGGLPAVSLGSVWAAPPLSARAQVVVGSGRHVDTSVRFFSAVTARTDGRRRACGGMPALLLPLAVETENVEIARTHLVFRLLQFQPYLPPYSLRPMPKAVYSRPKEGNQFCFGVAKKKLPLHLSYVGGREVVGGPAQIHEALLILTDRQKN